MATISHFEVPQFERPNDPDHSQEKPEAGAPAPVTKRQPSGVQEFELKKLVGNTQFRNPAARGSAREEARAQAVHQDRFKLSQLAKEAQGEAEKETRLVNETVQSRVKAETEVARAVGVKEGYVEGLAKGREEALAEYRQGAGEKVERFEQIIQAMEQAKIQVFEANQKFLVDLAFRVGRSVLLRELATDKEYVLRLARGLLEKTEIRENLTLKLNPEDAVLVDELKAGLQATFANLRNITVETSSEVRGGGAILESEWGAIDASLETQLARLQAALQPSTLMED